MYLSISLFTGCCVVFVLFVWKQKTNVFMLPFEGCRNASTPPSIVRLVPDRVVVSSKFVTLSTHEEEFCVGLNHHAQRCGLYALMHGLRTVSLRKVNATDPERMSLFVRIDSSVVNVHFCDSSLGQREKKCKAKSEKIKSSLVLLWAQKAPQHKINLSVLNHALIISSLFLSLCDSVDIVGWQSQDHCSQSLLAFSTTITTTTTTTPTITASTTAIL